MQYVPENALAENVARNVCLSGAALLLLCLTGCGANTTSTSPAAATSGPQTYFAPFVAATTNGSQNSVLPGPKIYAIDDFAKTFSQSTFQLQLPEQQGPQVINTGCFLSQVQCIPNVVAVAAGQRGLLSLGITTNYTLDTTTGVFDANNYNPPKVGSFAVELAGQAGGLIQLVGQPVSPIVAAVQCPNLKSPETYQFVTIPAGLTNSVPTQHLAATWNPMTDTAYGSVDISSSGSTVTFNNIHQYTLPSVGGTGAPAQGPQSSVASACGATVFGETITVGQLTVTNPQPGGGASTPPQASVGIGPTGLLVEHNGGGDASVAFPGTMPGLFYDNTLGAGTGAVGLPKPSSALNTGTLVSAQYLGFVYGAGIYNGNPAVAPTGWSSHLTSFGFSSAPSSCASVTASTSTLIYGGDFTNDDPSTSSNGFGNCDLAIDLGTQDPSNNGLFPKATVWLGASYAGNTTGQTYSFSAVAIAGQLNGKDAIFVLGVDSTQPWAIDLLQSN